LRTGFAAADLRARGLVAERRAAAFGRLADLRATAGFRPAFVFLAPRVALRLAIGLVLSATLTVLR
jgi:hypothetical protein